MNQKLFFILGLFCLTPLFGKTKLSKEIYNNVPFSSQFSDSGALIQNIHFKPVNDLIPQLEKKYNLKLKSRGEAHITVLTPPEAQGWFNPDKIGVNTYYPTKDIQKKYSPNIQSNSFEVLCVGKQTNKKGHIVFYLVVKTKKSFEVRKEIQLEQEKRAKGKPTYFNHQDYYPHITIGFVKGDVHGVSKDKTTCVEEIEWM